MTSYQYENLGPDRFQEFCQALLLRYFPNLICFPIGQPDGGRDAAILARKNSAEDEFIVLQVKFIKRPYADGAHEKLLKAMRAELRKIRRLVDKGATKYYLVTNVPGTGHPEGGSIDRMNSMLGKLVKSTCWWRDDIDRRLDGHWGLKWEYPEILSGSDLLTLLFCQGTLKVKENHLYALRAFMQEQYDREKKIRFRQIDLHNDLFGLFVDVPIATNNLDPRWAVFSLPGDPRQFGYADLDVGDFSVDDFIIHHWPHQLAPLPSEQWNDEVLIPDDDWHASGPRAASLFLSHWFQKDVPAVVLEGAPGQGKSTVVQYICQIHRARILGLDAELDKIPAGHGSVALRIPFKVDLRDFAAWVSGGDPFPAQERLPSKNSFRSLEGFLATQVHYYSGGVQFSVEDLILAAKSSPLLLILDGLDEVADIQSREGVIKEATRGIRRLRANSLSLQVIVTTRPAAFANSPGFPQEDYPRVELVPISQEVAWEYAAKWMLSKGLDEGQRREMRHTLATKLQQPHLRDLARSPMQLAILLTLIHTRGVSLPEKRTALYSSYIDLFFDREAEKSAIVRDYRDVLIDLHRYLAWLLHSEAEISGERGSLTSERLIAIVENYLESEDREPAIAGLLFKGLVERVVALVSRVEGTYEFEIQPIREFFAARFLYDTAPYSPPGSEMAGTKPDRFDAISRNFYWQNVTRFYAGCYSKGELPSLVFCIKELVSDDRFKRLAYPRLLALICASDWVFSQHPRSLSEVLRIVSDGAGLRHLALATLRGGWSTSYIGIPHAAGRRVLAQNIMDKLLTYPPFDFARDICALALQLIGRVEIKEAWLAALDSQNVRGLWYLYGSWMEVTTDIRQEALSLAITDWDTNHIRALAMSLNWNLIGEKEEALDVALNSILEHDLTGVEYGLMHKLLATKLMSKEHIPGEFEGFVIAALFFGSFDFRRPHYALSDFTNILARRLRPSSERELHEHPESRANAVLEKCCTKFRDLAVQVLSSTPSAMWLRSLEPWSSIVDGGARLFGARWYFVVTANLSAGIRSRDASCSEYSSYFNEELSLCKRTRYARLRSGNRTWWRSVLTSKLSDSDCLRALLNFLTWSSKRTLLDLAPIADSLLASLTEYQWEHLAKAIAHTLARTEPAKVTIGANTRINHLSHRFRLAAFLRLHRYSIAQLRECFDNYDGNDQITSDYVAYLAARMLARSQVHEWKDYLNLIRNSYRRSADGKGPFAVGALHEIYRFQQGKGRMMTDCAKEILDSPEDFPGFLVRAAEECWRVDVAMRVTPTRKVAEDQGWFRDPSDDPQIGPLSR